MSLFAALFIGTALGILVADFRNYRRAGPLNARPTTIGELSDGRPPSSWEE